MNRQLEIWRPVVRHAKFEMRAAFQHWKSSLRNGNRFRGQRGLKVHIGCGSMVKAGWVNMDLTKQPGIICWDFRHPLPFDDNSVSVIFSEHFIEHLDHPGDTGRLLAECVRVLEPGGWLRLVVPDAGLYVGAYGKSWEPLIQARPLTKDGDAYKDFWFDERYRTQMELINSVFRQSGEHRFAYDEETLGLVLKSAGFDRVERRSFGESAHPEGALDRPVRRTESLYMEGQKASVS